MGAGAGQSARSQNQTQALEVDRAAAEAELEVARPAEGAVHRVVGIDADATVEVLGGVGHPVGALGGPELGDGQGLVGGQPLARRHAA